VKPEPPPKPVAPPLPFTYMGSYAPNGAKPVFFLTQGDRVYDVHIGDTLDGTYSVDAFNNGRWSSRISLLTNNNNSLQEALREELMAPHCGADSDSGSGDRLRGRAAASRRAGGHRERGIRERGGVAQPGGAQRPAQHDLPARSGARREAAIQQLISLADTARSAHQLDVAAQDYKRVLTIDPNNDRAKRGLAGLAGDARHGDVIAQARKDFERKDYDAAEAKLRAVLNESPGYGPAQDLAAEITATRGPITVAPRLKTRDNHKVTCSCATRPPRWCSSAVARDRHQFHSRQGREERRQDHHLRAGRSVEQAIDLVLDQNALARQILADNMVLIYPNIAAKQKDYEQQIVRTFYLTNAAPRKWRRC